MLFPISILIRICSEFTSLYTYLRLGEHVFCLQHIVRFGFPERDQVVIDTLDGKSVTIQSAAIARDVRQFLNRQTLELTPSDATT